MDSSKPKPKEQQFDINITGKCKSFYRVVLNMDDILTMPSVDIPIDQRLRKDFGLKKKKGKKNKTRKYNIKCNKNSKRCTARVILSPNQ